MFTGIIEEVGTVVEVHRQTGNVRLRVEAPVSALELRVNDSVSLNGACQTVVWKEGGRFDVVAVEETLNKTTLDSWVSGFKVNIELPMRLNARLGGHIVLGHVDVVGEIVNIQPREGSTLVQIAVPEIFRKHLVPIGSIAVDGVSLTLAGVDGSRAMVSVIPHTLENTIFSGYRKTSKVNVEFDIIGKYVEQLLAGRGASKPSDSFPDKSNLTKMGY